MTEDAAPEAVATAYMLIHETLMLFTGIRFFWQQQKWNTLSRSLFLKDGPLTLRGQYSKLVIPIREFLCFARDQGVTIHLAGQEKTGAFVDHLALVSRGVPTPCYFIPDQRHIRGEVQRRPDRGEPYGLRTNYGNKIFVCLDDYHSMVLSIPTGEHKDASELTEMLGGAAILSSMRGLASFKHEGALVPIELANGVASLSSYPSAEILRLFADL